jgi:amino acid adenylation domain-containing protein
MMIVNDPVCEESVTTLSNADASPIHQWFEQTAAQYPENLAVSHGGKTLTYFELNAQANRVARYLIAQGCTSETVVGIYMTRSIDVVIAMLAVLKTGASYVPLDSAYPFQRIQYIVQDARIAMVLSHSTLIREIEGSVAAIYCLDSLHSETKSLSGGNIDLSISASNRMYILYTSGSTGSPKGVQISHAAMDNFLKSMLKKPGARINDRVAFITTICFDISGLEIFLPLAAGAGIIIVPESISSDGLALSQFIAEQDISLMQATPATWQMLLITGWQGKSDMRILCGGEAMPTELARQLLVRSKEVWNMYGPTETTIWSTVHRVDSADDPVPIGSPIDQTELRVLDDDMHPVAPGESGELYIGGAGLSMGYLGRSELTAQRFIRLANEPATANRFYRTGDLVRQTAHGALEFVGRADFQVKIRGYRIELGEIERQLELLPLIRQAIVVAPQSADGNRRLVGYYLAESQMHQDQLRTHLSAKLPEYMIPSLFVALDSFPLTLNGKIDRKALCDRGIQNASPQARTTTPPTTPLEKEIVGLWEELLGIDGIGIHDGFLELGGHSLIANRMVTRLNQLYDIKLSLFEVLTKGLTIAELSKLVETQLFESISEDDLSILMNEVDGMSVEELRVFLSKDNE